MVVSFVSFISSLEPRDCVDVIFAILHVSLTATTAIRSVEQKSYCKAKIGCEEYCAGVCFRVSVTRVVVEV